MQDLFILENEQRIEAHQVCNYPEVASNSWLFCRLEGLARYCKIIIQNVSLELSHFPPFFQFFDYFCLVVLHCLPRHCEPRPGRLEFDLRLDMST